MSVGSIIGGGVHLVRKQPKVVAVWAALYAVIAVISLIVTRPLMASMMTMQRPTPVNAATGLGSPPVFPAAAFGNLFLFELVALVFAVIAFAAVVRAVIRPTGDRFAYLRLGMDELRLIGLGIILAILGLVAEIVGVTLMILLAGLATFVIGRPAAIAIGVILGIALFGALIYAQVRISLAGVFTIVEGRIAIKDAWRATKGQFWNLFGAYLVIGLVYLVFVIVVLAFTSPHLPAAYTSFNPQVLQVIAQEQYGAQTSALTVGLIVRKILAAVFVVPIAVVLVGGMANAALELSGVQKTVAAEFE